MAVELFQVVIYSVQVVIDMPVLEVAESRDSFAEPVLNFRKQVEFTFLANIPVPFVIVGDILVEFLSRAACRSDRHRSSYTSSQGSGKPVGGVGEGHVAHVKIVAHQFLTDHR